MRDKIKQLVDGTLIAIKKVYDKSGLYNLRVQILGKTGELTNMLKGLRNVPPEQKGEVGKVVNDAKLTLEGAFDAMQAQLREQEIQSSLKAQAIDISIDKPLRRIGSMHPLTQTRNMIVDFFVKLGFGVHDSPEIDTEFYNFEALNVPADHPARDMQDTFFVGEGVLLRSHTSNGQIRCMQQLTPPLKVLSPGTVYRADAIDATHSPMFHQIEGLVVDRSLSMCDLKGVLSLFAKFVFGDSTEIRFRPSYFPFTEPSVEVDASCNCINGCKICKGTRWIEILGAGMVNRRVLHNCGVDADEYSGFAFGMGLERINNILHGIPDMRVLFENDLRFLSQF
jgi:phenylalanyl-tRNA synthetase alpha chain